MAMDCEMCRVESSEAALTRIEHCSLQDSGERLFPFWHMLFCHYFVLEVHEAR